MIEAVVASAAFVALRTLDGNRALGMTRLFLLHVSWICLVLLMPVDVQVASIVLEWINNHFTDFETDANLSEFLEQFETLMENHVSL